MDVDEWGAGLRGTGSHGPDIGSSVQMNDESAASLQHSGAYALMDKPQTVAAHSALTSDDVARLRELLAGFSLPANDADLVQRFIDNIHNQSHGKDVTLSDDSLQHARSTSRSPRMSPSAGSLQDPLQLNSLFQQVDKDRMALENEQLKRQIQMIQLKRKQHPSLPINTTTSTSAALQSPDQADQVAHLSTQLKILAADKNYLLNRMRHSEAQTSRMESELRQLRSFLLSKVKPVCIASPPSSPEEEDMQVFDNVGTSSHHQVTASTSHYKQATPGVTPQHDSIDSIPPTQNSAESDRTLIVQSEGENQNGNVSNEAESSPERQKRQGSPVNPQLPESSGLQSPFKRPRREERHTPQAALSGTENGLITPVSVAETPEPYYRHRKNRATMGDAETEHLLLAAQRLARVTKSVDWRPEVSRSINDRLASTSKSASRQMQPFVFPAQPLAARQAGSAGLKSMFPQSLDRPPVPSSGDSGLITNGLRSPMKSSTASTSARATYQHLDADTGVVSSSASPPLPIGAHDDADAEDGDVEKSNLLPSFRKDNPNKRVGRPAGTPNKTKTISINQTAAVRRRARRLQYIASNGGRGRGRGRPVRDSYGSPHLGERRGGHGEGTGSVDDLLFAAHMRNLTAGDEDAFYEEDEDAEGYDDDDDLYADNGMDDVQPPAMSSRTRQGSSNRRAAEISPATPRIPPANRNGVPATPNTIDRQRSALDVLAEASASADPASKRRGIPGGVHNDSRSASPLQTRRNLADAISAHDGHQQHNAAVWTGLGMPMDMTYPQPASNVTFDYSTLPPFPQPSLPIPTIQDWSYTQQPWDQQFPQPAASTSTDMSPRPVHSSYGYAIPQQLTIAQQLSHGVDESHPLIDHDDLISGMTPAAALAKKSRSPYVKWTPEEDEKLVVSIAQHGTRWDLVAKALPSRSYHQCRQRWLRGMRSGKALPKDMLHLQAQVDAAVEAYEQEKAGKKGNQKKDDVQEE